MKIGLLAYSSNTGLGHQTLEFYNNITTEKVLLIDLQKFNAMETHHDRYKNARICDGLPREDDIDWLLDGVDLVFECETPLNYYLHERAKKTGVKVVQQYNYEFLDYFRKPYLEGPTIFAAPAPWNMDRVEGMGKAAVKELPVPINRDKIPFREISECKTLVHIIGRPAFMDRNGTLSFLAAAERLGNKFRYVVYYQVPTDSRAREYFQPVKDELNRLRTSLNMEIIADIPNYQDMYTRGDVLVLPRRYGGLCLPMQEALSAGMPVIMTNISPNNAKLPSEWLVNATRQGEFEFHAKVDVYEADVQDLIRVINQFENPEFMKTANSNADSIAEMYSWKNQRENYYKFFDDIK